MLLDSDIARQFMDIMNDREHPLSYEKMKKLKELATDVREQQVELDGMDLNDCQSCKL